MVVVVLNEEKGKMQRKKRLIEEMIDAKGRKG